MSRGEFLGVGAMAAAGVGVGGMGAAVPNPTNDERFAAAAAPPLPQEPTWAIPAGILNALWGDIYPRLVACTWLGLGPLDQRPLLKSGMGAAGLRAAIKWFGDRGGPGEHAPARLRSRINKVLGFLEVYPNDAFPITIAADAGYDFLLSNLGIELFAPVKPPTSKDLLRYYTFRNTGRPSLGLPGYLTDSLTAISIDSPTGPSQVITSSNIVPLGGQVVFAEGVPVTYARVVATLSANRKWLVQGSVYRAIAVELPRIVSMMWLEEETSTHVKSVVARMQPTPKEREPGTFVLVERAPPVERLEAARVDRVEVQASAFFGSSDAYRSRFWRTDAEGLRSIFEERLETSLPPNMEFKVDTPASIPPGCGDAFWGRRQAQGHLDY